jgi:hypothetical protein
MSVPLADRKREGNRERDIEIERELEARKSHMIIMLRKDISQASVQESMLSFSNSLYLSLFLSVFLCICLQSLLAAPPIMLKCILIVLPSASGTSAKAKWLLFKILHS